MYRYTTVRHFIHIDTRTYVCDESAYYTSRAADTYITRAVCLNPTHRRFRHARSTARIV